MKHDGNDLLRRQDCIEAIEGITCSMSLCVNADECHGMQRMRRQAVIELANMPSAQPEPMWIPIKWRDCTDADREKYEFEEGITAVLDCEMPDNGQEILVTTLNGSVDKDTFYVDEDGYHSGSGWHDWDKDIIDIIAWRRLPEPYKKEGDA